MSSTRGRSEDVLQKKSAPFVFILLAVAATAIGVAACWPLPLGLTDTVPDTPFTDGHRIALGFGAGTVGPRILPHAGGVDFRPLLWPANVLAGVTGSVPALNLLFLLTPLFNAVSGWMLGRTMRAAPWGCFVLGGALAWCPWVHTTLANGQLEQAVIGGAALTWAAALATVQAQRGWWLALPLCAALSFVVGAAAPHVALAGGVGLAGWAGVDAWGLREGRSNGDRDRAIRWAAVLTATAIGAWAAGRYHAPSFDTAARLFAPFGSVDAAPVGHQVKRAVLLGDLVLRPAAPPRLANGVVHSGTLGISLLLTALAGSRWRRAPLVAGLTCLLLAFGAGATVAGSAIPLPYALLERLSPTIAASGTPYRFLIGTIVGLAAAAAGLPWGPRTALPFVLVLWAEAWWGDPRSLPLTARPIDLDPSSYALKAGVGPVLDLPVAGPRCKEGATHFLLEATVHARPVPVVMRPAYTAWREADPGSEAEPGEEAGSGRWDRNLARLLDRGLAGCDPAAIAAIRSAGFTAVVEHGHRSCNLDPAESACLRAAFGPGRSAGKVTWWELGEETPPGPLPAPPRTDPEEAPRKTRAAPMETEPNQIRRAGDTPNFQAR